MATRKNKPHTSPYTAGEHNVENMNLPKDTDKLGEKLLPVYKQGMKNKRAYKGLWTDEQLVDSINEMFEYCVEVDILPNVAMLRLWLGVHRDTMHQWRTNKAKYPSKAEIIGTAYEMIECYLQGNIFKYPTGSTFLLKTTFGHVDTKKIDITTDTVDTEDIKEKIGRLGLDK